MLKVLVVVLLVSLSIEAGLILPGYKSDLVDISAKGDSGEPYGSETYEDGYGQQQNEYEQIKAYKPTEKQIAQPSQPSQSPQPQVYNTNTYQSEPIPPPVKYNTGTYGSVYPQIEKCLASQDLTSVPGDCTILRRCVGGVLYKVKCPGNLVFDEKIKVCNYPSLVAGPCGTAKTYDSNYQALPPAYPNGGY